MDSPWKLMGTVIGCVVLDFGARFLWQLAKDRGRQEAFDEMANDETYVKKGSYGEPVVIVCNGEEYYLKIEKK